MNKQRHEILLDSSSDKNSLSEYTAELLSALNHFFISVVKLELDTGKAWLLHNKTEKQEQNQQLLELDLETFFHFYHPILKPEEITKLSKAISLPKLKQQKSIGNQQYQINLSCRPETKITELEITVCFTENKQKQIAYLFTRHSQNNHLLRQIIDLYVYSNCDYFIYLDAKNNSYTTFSRSESGTPLPPAECNDYSTELVKYAEEFVVPEDREMVIREMSLDRIISVLEKQEVHTIACGVWEEGRGYTRKNLEYRYFNREQQMILLSRTDITALYNIQQQHTKELEEALLQAQTDPLTGLWNSQGIQDVVKKELKHLHQKAALFFLDLDNFKLVNDTYGHAIGDMALQAVAKVLKQNIRTKDHASRIGGDEFVVYLHDIPSAETALDCAERICTQLSQICLENTKAQLSGSLGVAIAPEEGLSYKELVENADKKVYQAKFAGKNRFAF